MASPVDLIGQALHGGHTTGDLSVMEIVDDVISSPSDGGEAALGVRNPIRTQGAHHSRV